MDITGIKLLEKLKKKNKGNTVLIEAVDQLIKDLKGANWQGPLELTQDRSDADCVHSDGFYFFNLSVHRTMVLIEFEDEEATIVWAGSHDEYQNTFKDNKNTIKKWLRRKGHID